MSGYYKIGGSCLNQIPLDFTGNLSRIRKAIQLARTAGIQVLCLPELCISGYGCEDAFFRDEVLLKSKQSLATLEEESSGMAIFVGLPLEIGGRVFNAVAGLIDGKLCGFTLKSRLAGEGIYYEPRWFCAGDGTTSPWEWQSGVVQVGNPVYQWGDIIMGIEICEDAWAADRPALQYYEKGVNLILNPSASNFEMGKSHIREQIVTESSRTFHCTYVYANLLGNEAGRIIYDGEILIASEGNLIARNRRFSYQEVSTLSSIVNLTDNQFVNRKTVYYRANSTGICKLSDLLKPLSEPYEINPPVEVFRESVEEEFFRAATLGLFDYLRKSKSKGFVLSLSGGADSSACAVLAAYALWNAQDELGVEGLKERLQYVNLLDDRPLVNQLLTCVYQATTQNGAATLESAESLAQGLGANFVFWEIDPIVRSYQQLVETTIQRELNWDVDDIALQNVQARVRVPGIWMLANIYGALLLTTANRSELSVGYTTMDGDSAGSLAPLAGVSKKFILQWLVWAEQKLDINELSYVNHLQPSAELRPVEKSQTDEEDLMPYDALQFIEDHWIQKGWDTERIVFALQKLYPEYLVEEWVEQFIGLWKRNQWKRERTAPGFHLDTYTIDSRTGYRYPIFSGN